MSNINVDNITPLAGTTGTVAISGSLLVSGSVTANGNIILGNEVGDSVTLGAEVSSSIIPDANNTYNLGSDSKTWKKVHQSTASIGQVSSSLIPNIDDTYDLGSSTVQWKDLYVDGVAYIDELGENVSSSGNITALNFIATGSEGNITASGNILVTGNVSSSLTSTGSFGHMFVTSTSSSNVVATTLTVNNATTFQNDVTLKAGSANIINSTSDELVIGSSATGITIGQAAYPLLVDSNITASLNISGSSTSTITIGGTLTAKGNTALGDTSADTHTFIGNITASGDISASGTIFADNFQSTGEDAGGITFADDLNLTGDITASGNISASGTLDITGNVNFDGNLDVDGTTNLDIVDIDGAVDMASTLVVGNTISSSTTITGNNLVATGSAGNVTATGTGSFSKGLLTSGDVLTINNVGTVSGSLTSTGSFGALIVEGTGDGALTINNVGTVSGSSFSTGSFGRLFTGGNTRTNNLTAGNKVKANEVIAPIVSSSLLFTTGSVTTEGSTRIEGGSIRIKGANMTSVSPLEVDATHCGDTSGSKFTVQNLLQAETSGGMTTTQFTVGNPDINVDSVVFGNLIGSLNGTLSASALTINVTTATASFSFLTPHSSSLGFGNDALAANNQPFTASFVVL